MALKKEAEYAAHSDSDSITLMNEIKALQRKHPVKHAQLDLADLIGEGKL